MIDPESGAPAEAFRAGAPSEDTELARAIDAMWSQALLVAKRIMDGELPVAEEPSPKRRRWGRGS
jgi:hypothetical protein